MDWFSFNYKPKDFKKGDRDKTLPEILEMKPSKVGLDFFTKYPQEIAEAGLRPETISAIHFLSDLRNKGDIFDKCYKSGQHSHMKRSSPHPMPIQSQQPIQAQQPIQSQQHIQAQQHIQETVLGERDERPLIENQEGGRRRSIKHHSKKHHIKKHHSIKHHSIKHHSKKHHSIKHHSKKHHSIKHHSKKHHRGIHTECTHSGGKRISKHRNKRSKHRRTYKGGAFQGPNDVLNKSNPSPTLQAYRPRIDTSK